MSPEAAACLSFSDTSKSPVSAIAASLEAASPVRSCLHRSTTTTPENGNKIISVDVWQMAGTRILAYRPLKMEAETCARGGGGGGGGYRYLR